MNDTNQLIGVFTVFLGAGLTSCGFLIKYVMDHLKGSINELKTEIYRTNDRIDQRMGRLELRIDTMGADIADMRPKVNSLWEHFLTIKKPGQ